MKKKILIIGSSGNLGNYLFKELKKKNDLIGIQRHKKKHFFECEDLSDVNMNFKPLN